MTFAIIVSITPRRIYLSASQSAGYKDQQIIILINKTDMVDETVLKTIEQRISNQFDGIEKLRLSAKHNINILELLDLLAASFEPVLSKNDAVIITNARHFDSLYNAKENLERALSAIDQRIPTDLLAMDIRQVLHYIGEITGEITTDEILGSIFSKFCIGK